MSQSHAERSDAGQLASVLAELRMIFGFERRDNLKIAGRGRQRDNPLSHTPGGPVDGEFEGSHRFKVRGSGDGDACRQMQGAMRRTEWTTSVER